MPQHLKLFEWLVYGSLALDAVSTFVFQPKEAIAFIVVGVVIIALTWAAARRAQRWAAWVLAALALLGVLFVVSNFWAGAPSWLREIRSDAPMTTAEKILDLIAILLMVAGLYFYFFGDTRRIPDNRPDPGIR